MKFEINKIGTYKGHKDSIYDLAEGISSGQFISASGDGYVVEWPTPDTGVPIAKVDHPIYAIEHLKEKEKIWIGENSQGLHLIDTSRKSKEAFLKLGKVSVFSIKTFGNRTFAANSLGYVHVIDNDENRFIKHLHDSDKSARTLAISPEREELAVGYSDNKIRIYDLKSLRLIHTIEAHKNSVFTLLYNDNYLISSGRDAHIKVWDSSLGYLAAESVPAHNYAVNHLLALDGTSLLASCSMDKSIKIWDINSLQLLKVIDKGKFAGHGTSVNKLWRNKETQTLFSGSDDRTISEWKLF